MPLRDKRERERDFLPSTALCALDGALCALCASVHVQVLTDVRCDGRPVAPGALALDTAAAWSAVEALAPRSLHFTWALSDEQKQVCR